MTRLIAALFVQRGGGYYGLDGVDPWDEQRDARSYRGPHPVVAHPPCSRWCRLAGLVEARWGYERGVDGACFASALASVRAYGGVLEHPAHTDAWAAYGLSHPNRNGGWSTSDAWGGRTCHVEQVRYGHRARKGTWLYSVGGDFPELLWGYGQRGVGIVSWCGNSRGKWWAGPLDDKRPRLESKERSATPQAFREVLIAIARSVTMRPRVRVLPQRIRVQETDLFAAVGCKRLRTNAHGWLSRT